MSAERTRERIVEMVRLMRENTVSRGCTPGEAAKFAAKAAELIEKFDIDEAELRVSKGDSEELEVCQNILATGKKAHNPGMTAVVNALAKGMCCQCIYLPAGYKGRADAAYGIIGSVLDADYVCQISTTVVPALQVMAACEGEEYGHTRRGEAMKWTNEYLAGAAIEIQQRLERDRRERAELKMLEHHLATGGNTSSTALVCITGETLAIEKRKASEQVFNDLYPVTRKVSRRSSSYNHEARTRGREAGKHVGLRLELE